MKKLKTFLPILFALILVISGTMTSFACTGVYVGEGYSQNGSTYVGRSEDAEDNWTKIFGVAEATDWPEGAVYTSAENSFKMPKPAHTYRYTYMKDSPAEWDDFRAEEAYGESGVNEHGLTVTATVTTYGNRKAAAVDPLEKETGIGEFSIASILLGGATNAREAIELMAKILDKYGSSEYNSLMVADANETWYMEIVSGHQYAAIKMDPNKVSVQPNIMLLGAIDVNDKENVIVSENLVKTAEDGGFLQTDEAGRIHVAKTYAKSGRMNSRSWQGMNYFDPSLAAKYTNKNDNGNEIPLLFDSNRKLSTLEVLRLLAYRGEGTKYDSNTTNNYAIGNTVQQQVHIMEIRKNLPKDLATLHWQGLADAEFTIYVPYYSTILTGVNEKYKSESRKYVDDSMNWVFNAINNICSSDRKLYGENVKKYFTMYQESLIEQQKTVDQDMMLFYNTDPKLASEKATEIGKNISEQTYQAAKKVLDELKAYKEAKKFDKPFVPSGLTNNEMPKYAFNKTDAEVITPADEGEVENPRPEDKVLKISVDAGLNKQYKLTFNGDEVTYVKGTSTGMLFKLEGANLEDFLGLYLDGEVVDESNFIKSQGSINIELKKEFLDSIKSGKHTLKIVATTGYGEKTFSVADEVKAGADKKVNAVTKVINAAKTGDTNNLSLFLGLGFAAIVTLVAVTLKKRV